jgi:MarR family transcriptional regulator, organic hydroperoxide resistance regulator
MIRRQTIRNIVDLQQQFDQAMVKNNFKHWMASDLTAKQFKLLFYIVQNGTATSKKLSGILGVTPSDVTGVIDRLIVQGLVKRQENPEDRRFSLLKATEKGRMTIEELSHNAVERIITLLEGMSEEELEHLYLGLSAVIRAMHDLTLNNPTPTINK